MREPGSYTTLPLPLGPPNNDFEKPDSSHICGGSFCQRRGDSSAPPWGLATSVDMRSCRSPSRQHPDPSRALGWHSALSVTFVNLRFQSLNCSAAEWVQEARSKALAGQSGRNAEERREGAGALAAGRLQVRAGGRTAPGSPGRSRPPHSLSSPLNVGQPLRAGARVVCLRISESQSPRGSEK